jgi:hypothetical protein
MFEAFDMTQANPSEWRKAADELGGMWRRISRQHLASGQGCACGFGVGLMLQGAAFELDIVEFLIDEARKAGHTGIETMVETVAQRGNDNYSLTALIEALGQADSPGALDDAQIAFALERLRLTLSAMDEAHTGGRFACD